MGAWALSLAYRQAGHAGKLQLGTARPRCVLLGALVLMNLVVVLARKPEDSGPFTSLGAKRWVETGVLPYGDVRLRGPRSPGFGAAATYGPVLDRGPRSLPGADRNAVDRSRGAAQVR